jgi:hypothetical protein
MGTSVRVRISHESRLVKFGAGPEPFPPEYARRLAVRGTAGSRAERSQQPAVRTCRWDCRRSHAGRDLQAVHSCCRSSQQNACLGVELLMGWSGACCLNQISSLLERGQGGAGTLVRPSPAPAPLGSRYLRLSTGNSLSFQCLPALSSSMKFQCFSPPVTGDQQSIITD